MALHPIKNLPSHARSHYFGLFVTRHEGPNVNPDLESIQNNSKRQLHNLSHITERRLAIFIWPVTVRKYLVLWVFVHLDICQRIVESDRLDMKKGLDTQLPKAIYCPGTTLHM